MSKRVVFRPFCAKYCTNAATIGAIFLNKNGVSNTFHKKGTTYPSWIRRNEFFKKSATEFPTLHHLPSRC